VPDFSYKAIDSKGQIIKGSLPAIDEFDLETKLMQKGLVLIKCRKIKDSLLFRFGWINTKLIIEFYNRLYQAIEIGLPLISALDEIAQTLPSRLLKKVIGDISLAIEAGNTLYDAMSRFPHIFSKLELNVIRMGEKSGTLPLCLRELVNFLEWREETRSTVKRAAIYPSFIVILVSGVMAVWIGYVLPQMAKLLMDMGMKLPKTTVIILKISMFMKIWASFIIGGIVVCGTAIFVFINTHYGKKLFHKYLLKIPLLGPIFLNISLARLCNNFAIMYRAGVSINDIFEILADNSLGNKYMEEQVVLAFQYIQAGQHISEGFENTGIFPAFLIGAIKNGEVTGNLDDSFKRLAEYYDREVKNRVQTLISALEPLTMMVLGGVFGLVALSILLPLYNLIGSLGKSY